MPNQQYSPIQSVNGVTVPCPSAYQYKLSDVSAADAGRTEAAVMDKMRIAQKVHLELEWWNVPTETASAILQAFDAEYFNVTYLDVKAGGFQTKQFYAGDRSSPLYNYSIRTGVWSKVAFNIIER